MTDKFSEEMGISENLNSVLKGILNLVIASKI